MYLKRLFASKYYPGDSFVMFAPIIWGIIIIILNEFLPRNVMIPIGRFFLVLDIIVYMLLFVSWFIEGFDKIELEKQIRVAKFGKRTPDYSDEDLEILELCHLDFVKPKVRHVHVLKSYKNINGRSAQLFSIYFVLSLVCNYVSFNSWMPYSIVLFLVLLIIAILISLGLFLFELRENGIRNTGALLGDLLMVGIFGFMFYHPYTKHFGESKLGSLLEKPDYTTQYYVNLFADKGNSKNYRVVADIHVYSTVEQDGEDSYSEKHIVVEKVYWPNGGYTTFDDCELEDGDSGYCTDDEDRSWYIELTDKQPIKKDADN
jgi:hypothetical protein